MEPSLCKSAIYSPSKPPLRVHSFWLSLAALFAFFLLALTIALLTISLGA